MARCGEAGLAMKTLAEAGRMVQAHFPPTVAVEEVAQLYLHDRVGSRVRPVRELRGFRKLRLAPGESREVVFHLSRANLAFTRADGSHGAEPGAFDAWIAPSSTTGEPARFTLLPP